MNRLRNQPGQPAGRESIQVEDTGRAAEVLDFQTRARLDMGEIERRAARQQFGKDRSGFVVGKAKTSVVNVLRLRQKATVGWQKELEIYAAKKERAENRIKELRTRKDHADQLLLSSAGWHNGLKNKALTLVGGKRTRTLGNKIVAKYWGVNSAIQGGLARLLGSDLGKLQSRHEQVEATISEILRNASPLILEQASRQRKGSETSILHWNTASHEEKVEIMESVSRNGGLGWKENHALRSAANRVRTLLSKPAYANFAEIATMEPVSRLLSSGDEVYERLTGNTQDALHESGMGENMILALCAAARRTAQGRNISISRLIEASLLRRSGIEAWDRLVERTDDNSSASLMRFHEGALNLFGQVRIPAVLATGRNGERTALVRLDTRVRQGTSSRMPRLADAA